MDAHEYIWFSLKFQYFMCFWLTCFLVRVFHWFWYDYDWFQSDFDLFPINDRYGSNNIVSSADERMKKGRNQKEEKESLAFDLDYWFGYSLDVVTSNVLMNIELSLSHKERLIGFAPTSGLNICVFLSHYLMVILLLFHVQVVEIFFCINT